MTAGTTKCSDIVSAGADFLDGNVATATSAYSAGSNGVKLGTSSGNGVLKMNLSTAGQVKAKSIVVNCKLYNSSKTATLAVNGKAAQSVTADGSDLTFDIDADITYIELTSSKYIWVSSIKVIYEGLTLYLVPSMWATGGEKFAIYYGNADWSVAGWSEFMDLVEGESSIYQAEIPKGMKYAIYVRLNSSLDAPDWGDGKAYNQTENLEIPADSKNCVTITAWHSGDESTPSTSSWSAYTAPVLTDVFFVNIDNWADVKVYAWLKSDDSQNNGWPGVEMTKTGDKLYGSDIYKGRISATYNMVIISNDGSATERTGDQPFDKTKPYFYSGKWYASVAAIPANCAYINAQTSGAATLAAGAVVTFASGLFAYIKDASGAALIYKSSHGLVTGDTILVDVAGTCKASSKLPEFEPAAAIAAAEKKAGKEPEYPDAVAEPSADNLNQVVVYKNVTFASSEYSNKNITGKWGDKSITFRDQFSKNIKFDTDKKYDIVAANSRYNDNMQAYIISAEKVCQDGPYGLNVNGVADTLKLVYDPNFDQYGIDNKVVEKDDEILLENLSCNVTWLPQIEDGGAKDNFEVVGDKLKVKVAGTYNFYFKKIPGDEKIYIDYSPITKWYIAGGFNNWTLNDDSELKATEKADSIAIVIELKSDTAVNFKLVRVVTKGSDVSTWYGLKKDSEGKVDEMRYGHSSGFWFYNDGLENVKLHPTNANDNYTFGVNISNPDIPVVTVIIPEEKAIEKTFKVKVPAGTEKVYMGADWDPAVDGWEFEEMEADGENQFKFTASVLKAFEYKYSAAEDFEHVEVAADRSYVPNRTYGDTTDVVALFKNPKWSNIYLWRKSNGYAGEELLMEDPTKPELLSVPVNYTAAMLDSFLIVDANSDPVKFYKIANDAEDMSRANSIQWTLVENDARNVAINIDQAGGYIFVWEPDDYKISVLYPAEPKIDITFQVKVPEGTENCYIAGDWEGDGTWTFKQMSKVDAIDHQFELKVEDIVASVPYKYSAADDWEHGEVKADRTEVDNRTYAGGIDEVALFKDPAWTNIFLHNDFNAGWNDVEFVATEDPNVFKATLDITEAKIAELMINELGTYYKHDDSKPNYTRENSGQWWELEVAADGKKGVYLDADVTGVYTFLWAKDTKNINITFPAEPKVDITFKAKAPEGTVDCYIAGDWDGDGTWTFEKMNVVDHTDYQFELKIENILASVEYKYYAAEDLDRYEVAADRSGVANRTYQGGIDEVALFNDPAWTNIFIKGAFNEWKNVEFVVADPLVPTVLIASIEIGEAAVYDFVITDNGVLYKSPSDAADYLRADSDAKNWKPLYKDGEGGDKNVWMNADVKGAYQFSWATDTKNFSIAYPKATGCENVYGTDVELRKVIENGVLFIYRDGKVYNVQGQLVK